MKFKKFLIFTIVSIAILSCKNKESNAEPQSIDLSTFGSVNMIKEIGGEIYVLNSTTSSVYRLDGDSLKLFRDLKIGGRDFLQDFDIEGDKVYYSNTYDEIFVSSGNAIGDTIMVINPDRIAVIDSLLYVTSRKNEEWYFYLKLFDIKSKKEVSCIPLNDSLITEMKFAQVSIAEDRYGLLVLNPFRNRLEKYNADLKIISSIDLPAGYEYGNFSISDGGLKIIASRGDEIFICLIQNGKTEFLPIKNIKSQSIDIRSSYINKDRVLLYDYIDGKIIIR
jgi:hypothetical protein